MEKWFNIGGNRSIVTRYRLDSQFHCSYLESRGVPGKNAGNYLPFISGDVISGDATSGDATSGDVISGDAISGDATSGDVTIHHTIHHKYEVDGASILLM
jgi:hypothetical protein